MPDILQDFPVRASREAVYRAITDPAGLDAWWTVDSRGSPEPGQSYALGFGPGYSWRALVTRAVPGEEFQMELTQADEDWTGTRVGFRLEEAGGSTFVRFSHEGWGAANAHYRISCHCWAMYLRLLRRYLEHGEVVPYDQRLEV